MKNKFDKIKGIVACAFVLMIASPMATMADSPAELYDNVWRLINTKYGLDGVISIKINLKHLKMLM